VRKENAAIVTAAHLHPVVIILNCDGTR